jgi:hypothetical protein
LPRLGKNAPFLPNLGKTQIRPAAEFANAWQNPPLFAEPWQNPFPPPKKEVGPSRPLAYNSRISGKDAP